VITIYALSILFITRNNRTLNRFLKAVSQNAFNLISNLISNMIAKHVIIFGVTRRLPSQDFYFSGTECARQMGYDRSSWHVWTQETANVFTQGTRFAHFSFFRCSFFFFFSFPVLSALVIVRDTMW